MKKIGIIPARYDSTRLPGKPLADINGKPMIQWVYENTSKSNLDRVIVATDDKRVYDAVISFGGEVVMTSKGHINGSSRLAEVARELDCDIIVNIQGDEPCITPSVINKVIETLDDPNASMGTLKCRITSTEDIENPNNVKVVTDVEDNALYFSRSVIPHPRVDNDIPYFKHLGIYSYRRDFLLDYVKMDPTPLELTESLEQLRVLENGYKIKVFETDEHLIGVDTKEDLDRVREKLK